MKLIRLYSGIAIWVLVLGVAVSFLIAKSNESNNKAARSLLNYSAGPSQFVTFKYEAGEVSHYEPLIAVGDPIFVLQADGTYQHVGEIKSLKLEDDALLRYVGWTNECTAMFYNDAPLVSADCQMTMHETPASLEWVINEMTKDGAWEEYRADINAAFKAHSGEILDKLRPVIESGLREAAIVVGEDLKVAFASRKDRIAAIAARYEEGLVKEKIIPLVQEEIWPIVREHTEPRMNEVGSEIWQRASIWRFGWRFAYDKMPLPRKDLAKKEWQRFVDNEAVPVLESHFEDLIQMQGEILADVAKNDKVRRVLRESIDEIVNDKEIRQIVEEILIEVFVNNPRLNKVLTDHFNSEQTQNALSLASDRFETTIVEISEKMFGTPETQITPSFARVLRNQVLRKDFRWFILHLPADRGADPQATSQLKFSFGETGNENPFVQQKTIPLAKPR